MNAVVVGGGSWGTVFASLLRDRGHEATLACRDPEQVAAIRATGRNPRYARDVDLSGIEASVLTEAPVAVAELVVVAVPSRAFAAVRWRCSRGRTSRRRSHTGSPRQL